jgi:V/A-type H+-transporting ATPase subunit E
MRGIETGRDKVKKICDVLRKETIEPAKREAEEIIQEARQEAETLLIEAQKLAEKMVADARKEVEREKTIFISALQQACKQTLAALKQDIEGKLFNKQLSHLISKNTQDPKLLAGLITAVVHAVEKEGTEANLSVYIPAAVPAHDVNVLLSKEILAKLKEKSVLIGSFGGGIEVKMHDGNITLDISDATLKELVANYIRKDFRELFFGTL